MVKSTMASLASAGARGGMVTAVSQVVNIVVRTAAIVLFSRMFAPEIFGFIAVVGSMNTFMTAIVALGLPAAAMQASSLSRKAASTLLLISSTIGALCATILVVAAPLIASLFGGEQIQTIVYWLACVPLLMGFQSQYRVQMMRHLQFSTLAWVEVASTVVGTVIALVYGLVAHDYVAIVLQALAPVFLQSVLVAYFAHWRPSLPGNYSEVRQLLTIGVQAFGMGILQHGSKQLIVPAVALYLPPSDVGAYDRAQQLAVMPVNSVIDQLQRVAIPILSRLRDERARMLSFLVRAQLLIAYSTATLFFVLASISGEFVHLLLGPNWSTAGTLLQALAIGAAFRGLAQAVQWQFIADGSTRAGLLFSLWSQPLVAIVSVAGLWWGIEGVAWMNTLAWIAIWPASTLAVSRSSGFDSHDLLVSPLRAMVLFAIPAGLPGIFLSSLSWPSLVIVVVAPALSVLMCVASFVLVPSVRKDVQMVYSTLRLAIVRS